MDLLHTNIFYQYLVDLLNLVMHLFFQILSLLLLIFCTEDQEYMDSLGCALFYSCLCIHQSLSFILLIREHANSDKIAALTTTKNLTQ